MIRIDSSLSRWETTKTVSCLDAPIIRNLSSLSECNKSAYVIDSGSSNTVAASTKPMPCFRRFSVSFRGSHSINTRRLYHKIIALPMYFVAVSIIPLRGCRCAPPHPDNSDPISFALKRSAGFLTRGRTGMSALLWGTIFAVGRWHIKPASIVFCESGCVGPRMEDRRSRMEMIRAENAILYPPSSILDPVLRRSLLLYRLTLATK